MSKKAISNKKIISDGVAHTIPDDLRKALIADAKALAIWESLTPLARNEWICWTIFVKKAETRKEHIARVRSELKDGMRRPCCWLGCIHRKDKKISPSVQWILNKKSNTLLRGPVKGRGILKNQTNQKIKI